MSKAKKIFSNWKIILLIFFLFLAVLAISPQLDNDGVAIRSVEKGSAADLAGILSPQPDSQPTAREVITSINNKPIENTDDYYNFVQDLSPNRTLSIQTSKDVYRLTTQPLYNVTVLNETQTVPVVQQVYDNVTNTTQNVTEYITQNKTTREVIGTQDLGLGVYEAPANNIKKGLDLAGGTRVLLQPEEEVSKADMELILENIRQRLNVYGVSDILVKSVDDFTGEQYILVEIAGSSKQEVIDLLSQQGKFEAKVGNTTVFKGGDDIVFIDKSATGSGLDPQRGCSQTTLENGEDGWVCGFRFAISLSQSAAQAQAQATQNLSVEYLSGSTDGYLSENLSLFLDDELVDELRIGADLQGNPVTDISISGSGSGVTKQQATTNALQEMKELQTVLQTGSMPVKLTIIRSDTVSPVLGEEFIKNALFIGALAILAVVLVITVRYRRVKIALPAIIAMASEVVLILGFAALINWQLDLAAIAGILIAVGTGVDDQIVIIDETLNRKREERSRGWKDKLKKAFFIIMTAYFTTVVAMIPLLSSGAGLLKGFALTTIAGITFGVLITRPAFAKLLEILIDKKNDDDD